MQAANTERVSAVSAVFDAFPAFGSLKAECITDISCSAEQARHQIAQCAGGRDYRVPGAVHIHAGNGNIVGDSIRAAVMNRAGYAQAEKDNAYNGYTLRELARARAGGSWYRYFWCRCRHRRWLGWRSPIAAAISAIS